MIDHGQMLSVLARADAARLKTFAETLIADLGEIEVRHSRTGLVMLPMRDTAGGTAFHLGEVLMSEAHISAGAVEGYGMRRGRDLEAAMAMALVDLAVAKGVALAECHSFCAQEAASQAREDHDNLRRIEATRVDMETF
ncbi:phosphonate C-P lyase system protein PhnG [Antarctobacter heliothermus]|jgi:alpha-D-ribose 1-methylphosphonate 5-triphosphate synthase subunit PhnG|uniref:Alpha-D-ribose 1-methylphosphonate 5-triphosphate synthase subunit PhnG n=1 Tax=Antarctobacter heliothermus TaxID=74033 RepID=A0A239K9R1_9RHOB|nr:phosphonate C-P lyase system protein PhnG [Antarctobacter heliothermus]SNT14498.1 alpha-D-ribose 1-methylphosphonate 5-triphosphate synthase subunit PhnG [Antarctobacter heliothermus]